MCPDGLFIANSAAKHPEMMQDDPLVLYSNPCFHARRFTIKAIRRICIGKKESESHQDDPEICFHYLMANTFTG